MDKVILITGATSGIGEASAHIFASHGYKLILTGRRKERLTNLKIELEKKYSVQACDLCFDVCNADEVKKALDSIPDGFKPIDILLNNAGLAVGMSSIHNGEIDDWDKMIDTNIKGLLYVSRIISSMMVEQGHGHIINLASLAGKEAYPNGNVYCATKHAVDALSRCMRIDLLPYGIRVTNIAPGMVETEFSVVRFKGDEERAKQAYKGITPLTGKDIAEIIYYAAAAPANVNINDISITPLYQAMTRDAIRK